MVGPAIGSTIGKGLTINLRNVSKQPVAVLVKVNRVLPVDKPVIAPLLVIVAILGAELDQLPKELGDTAEVNPSQIVSFPIYARTGRSFTVILPTKVES